MRAIGGGVSTRIRAAALAPTVPPLAAATLSLLIVTERWRGADLPAQVFRVGLVKRFGLQVWDNFWFGGHHTVGYGVLFPVLGAVVGIWPVAVASSAASAWLVDALIVGGTGRRSWPATLWFAAGTAANVAIGRLPFALGMTIGLGALLAGQRDRRVLALVLSAATSMASPVVSVFLAIVWAAMAVVSAERRRQRMLLTAVTAAPVLIVAALFPQGGTFPFHLGALLSTVAVAGAVAVCTRRAAPLVAAVAVLYAIAAAAAFLVPSPLGANISRFGMFATAPALLAVVPARRRLVALVLPLVAFWQWSPAIDAPRLGAPTRPPFQPALLPAGADRRGLRAMAARHRRRLRRPGRRPTRRIRPRRGCAHRGRTAVPAARLVGRPLAGMEGHR